MDESSELETLVATARTRVGDATLTILANPDDDRRPLLSTLIFTAIALFVLKQYAAAFLKSLGLEELAKKHGQSAREFLFRIRAKEVTPDHIAEAMSALREALPQMRSAKETSSARLVAEAAIRAMLIDAGAAVAQAEDAAREVSRVLLK